MKKIARRAVICLFTVIFMISGLIIYIADFLKNGGEWVSFPVNRHVYNNAVLSVGSVTDRNGTVLADVRNNERVFGETGITRTSTLHVVGDMQGNIGTGALSFYATELMGYNPLNGTFSINKTGASLRLTVDAGLNAVAYQALGGRKGAVVFYNYKTGYVLCMVSAPAFDPSHPLEDEQLEPDEFEGVFINRCVSSSFTPGSVFKVVTLAAAIENIPGLFEMSFDCAGSVIIANETINCSGVHGSCDIREAFAVSCNVVFAQLAQTLGGETIEKYARDFGLLDRFDMSGIPVARGSFTAAPDKSAELSWSGIGQHENLINPLAMTRLMGAIANGGTAVAPRIVESVSGEFGFPKKIGYRVRSSERLMKKETAEILSEMLRYNTLNAYYNYHQLADFDGLSAKSGTAEQHDGSAPHAWFTGFLNDDANPVAFTVFVENAGWGLEQAAPVASAVLNHLSG